MNPKPWLCSGWIQFDEPEPTTEEVEPKSKPNKPGPFNRLRLPPTKEG